MEKLRFSENRRIRQADCNATTCDRKQLIKEYHDQVVHDKYVTPNCTIFSSTPESKSNESYQNGDVGRVMKYVEQGVGANILLVLACFINNKETAERAVKCRVAGVG
jgi:hypothetical protein